jgi:hypothetical protein
MAGIARAKAAEVDPVMPITKTPAIAVRGTGPRDAREFSMVSLDLKNEEAAVELAKRLAEQTGCTVTVRDADGELVGTFGGRTIKIRNGVPNSLLLSYEEILFRLLRR